MLVTTSATRVVSLVFASHSQSLPFLALFQRVRRAFLVWRLLRASLAQSRFRCLISCLHGVAFFFFGRSFFSFYHFSCHCSLSWDSGPRTLSFVCMIFVAGLVGGCVIEHDASSCTPRGGWVGGSSGLVACLCWSGFQQVWVLDRNQIHGSPLAVISDSSAVIQAFHYLSPFGVLFTAVGATCLFIFPFPLTCLLMVDIRCLPPVAGCDSASRSFIAFDCFRCTSHPCRPRRIRHDAALRFTLPAQLVLLLIPFSESKLVSYQHADNRLLPCHHLSDTPSFFLFGILSLLFYRPA